MKVAIIGAGGIGLGTAALVLSRGHEAALWSPSLAASELAAGAPLAASGAIAGTFHPRVAGGLDEALDGAGAVIVAVPGYGQRAVTEALAPLLSAGQTIILFAMASLSALHLGRLLAGRGLRLPVAASGTTVLTARRTGAAAVSVLTLRGRVDMAVIPAAEANAVVGTGRRLFGECIARADAMAVAFGNVNSVTHVGLALGNVTRIERAETWPQYHYMTEAVCRLILALDAERLAVGRAFGAAPPDVASHVARSFDVEEPSLAAMARTLHARRGGPPGPAAMETRYVVEDVPFGAVFTAAMGRIAGVPTPQHDAAITLLSTIWGRDFRRENDLLPALGLERMSVAAITAIARDGWPAAGGT